MLVLVLPKNKFATDRPTTHTIIGGGAAAAAVFAHDCHCRIFLPLQQQTETGFDPYGCQKDTTDRRRSSYAEAKICVWGNGKGFSRYSEEVVL